MSLIFFIIIAAAIGFFTWFVVNNVPMPQPIKNVIVFVVVLAIIFWVLSMLGLLPALSAFSVPKIH